MPKLFRKVCIKVIAVLALGIASLPTQASGQASSFLQITGIAGESADAQHQNWIDIQATSVGVVGPQQQVFHFATSSVSVASPALLLAAVSGQHLSNAVIGIRRGSGGSPDYLRYIMTDVVIVSDSIAANGASAPGEQINLSYSTLQIEYRQQRPDGTYGPPTVTCWDFVLGAPCG